MSDFVADAWAILALLNEDTGSEAVADAVTRGVAISTVNLSEVVAKLADAGVPDLVIRTVVGELSLECSSCSLPEASCSDTEKLPGYVGPLATL